MTDAENMTLHERLSKLIEETYQSDHLLAEMDAAVTKVMNGLKDLSRAREALNVAQFADLHERQRRAAGHILVENYLAHADFSTPSGDFEKTEDRSDD